MPNIVTNPDYNPGTTYASQDYGYKYPNDWNLKPDSELHRKIVTEVLARARVAHTAMSNRFSSWNKIDKTLTAYMPLDTAEEDLQDLDDRKPVSIVFPYSYAIMETLLSYMVAAFFQDPIFMYDGVGPGDLIGAILMEKVIDQMCDHNKVALPIHTHLRDGCGYGLGVVAPQWTKVMGQRVRKRALSRTMLSMLFGKEEYEKVVEDDVITYEGVSLRNVDPYKYLPDPNVPVQSVQEGEFVGWIDESRYITLLEQERVDPSMFNVRYLNELGSCFSSINTYNQSARGTKTGQTRVYDSVLKPVDVIYMYVKIVPKEWQLSESTKPEKWLFAVASDSVVIQAKPLGLVHNKFPIAVCAPDFDGYSSVPLSRIEVLYGMQTTLDWLFNSHIANVRKVVNDTLIVDPYLLNLNDLRTPRAGGIVRLRRPAWGRGVTGSYEQLKVTDVTRANIQDASWIMGLMDKGAGTDASIMGAMRQGGPERLTEGEFQGTRTGAVSRLERMARVIGLQSFQDIGYMFASYVQQFMSQEVYINNFGKWRDTLISTYGDVSRIKVDPMDLVIDYNLTVRDGSIPGGNFSKVWVQWFAAITKTPELMQTFDIVRIFKHIARNMGAKDVEQFVRKQPIQSRTMPDEEVMNQVGKGNLVPFPGKGAI